MKSSINMKLYAVGTFLSKITYTKLNGERRTWWDVEIVEVHDDWTLVKTYDGLKHLKHDGVNEVVKSQKPMGKVIRELTYLTHDEELIKFDLVEIDGEFDDYMVIKDGNKHIRIDLDRIVSKTIENYELMMLTKMPGATIENIIYTTSDGRLRVWSNVCVEEVYDDYSIVSTIDGLCHLKHKQVNFMN